MQDEPENPKASLEPVPPERPALARPRTWLVLLLIAACVLGSAVAINAWLDGGKGASTPEPQRQFHGRDDWRTPGRKAARQKMEKLAEALLQYREIDGAGIRWPDELEELKVAGHLEPEFGFQGPMSGREIFYQPDMPTDHDPSVWVLAHDRHVVTRNRRTYVIGAMVILADGKVRFLNAEEVDQYPGLRSGLD